MLKAFFNCDLLKTGYSDVANQTKRNFMNSLVLVAHLLNPNVSADSIRTQLNAAAINMGISDAVISICVEDDCRILPATTRRMLSDEEGQTEGSSGPVHEPHSPLPMIPPKTTGESGGTDKIQAIISSLKSLTADEGGIDVEYKYKNSKTDEETEFNMKINGSYAKGTSTTAK